MSSSKSESSKCRVRKAGKHQQKQQSRYSDVTAGVKAGAKAIRAGAAAR